MIDVLSISHPHVGHVGRICLSLAAQQGIVGHVEDGVRWGNQDNRRTCNEEMGKGNFKNHCDLQTVLNTTTRWQYLLIQAHCHSDYITVCVSGIYIFNTVAHKPVVLIVLQGKKIRSGNSYNLFSGERSS